MRRWTKIKFKDRVLLEWGEGDEEKTAVTHTLSSAEKPAPSFVAALEALVPSVLTLLELPEKYGEGMRVSGVSFTHEDERGRGAVVTCLKTIMGAQSPVVLNTPYLPESAEEEPSLPLRLRDALDHLCDEAEAFLGGEREQMDLLRADDGVRQAAQAFRDSIPEGHTVMLSTSGREPVTLHSRPKLVPR